MVSITVYLDTGKEKHSVTLNFDLQNLHYPFLNSLEYYEIVILGVLFFVFCIIVLN